MNTDSQDRHYHYESLVNIEAVRSYKIGSTFQNTSSLFSNVSVVSMFTTVLGEIVPEWMFGNKMNYTGSRVRHLLAFYSEVEIYASLICIPLVGTILRLNFDRTS